ncbi:hypothetical protein R3P38DRAFT_2761739 [Favolaschia claudopus]|uniref:Uncharacterized protein n=1 Tax=Favolaschia claudopus TaxID=2862362 RepID=A0AAW0DSG5_9AGAR
MAPGGWTKGPRLDWLMSRLPEYVKKHADGKLHLFWAPMYEDFFKAFPEQAELGLPLPSEVNGRELTADEEKRLGEALAKRKKQLDNWFHNSRKKTDSVVDVTSTKTMAIILRLLQLQGKGKRAHRPVEVFQLRNRDTVKVALTAAGYDGLLAENIEDDEDDWTDESEDSPAARLKTKKSKLMRLRTRVIAALWADTSEEERSAVEEAVEEEKRLLEDENSEEAITDIWARLEGIDSIETAVVHIHKALYAATKWVGFTILGGPHPRLKGQLSLKVICHGKTPMGNDFEDVCVGFDDNIIKPFSDFLRLVYSAKDCAEFELPAAASSTSTPAQASTDPAADSPAAESTVQRIYAPTEPIPAPAASTKTKKAKKAKKSPPKSSPTVNEDAEVSEQPLPTAVASSTAVNDRLDDIVITSEPAVSSGEEDMEVGDNTVGFEDVPAFDPSIPWGDLAPDAAQDFPDFDGEDYNPDFFLGGGSDFSIDNNSRSQLESPQPRSDDDHPPVLWLPRADALERPSPMQDVDSQPTTIRLDGVDFPLMPADQTVSPTFFPESMNSPAPTASSSPPPATAVMLSTPTPAPPANTSSVSSTPVGAFAAAARPSSAFPAQSWKSSTADVFGGTPADHFRRSSLFSAFSKRPTPPALPNAFTGASTTRPVPRALFGASGSAAKGPTLAASVALASIAAYAGSRTIPPTPTAIPSMSTPTGAATAPGPTSSPATPAPAASQTSPATPAPPPSTSPIAAAPHAASATRPASRPATRPASRPTIANPAPSKKPSVARTAAEKEGAAKHAGEVAKKVAEVEKKGRGRPRKVPPLDDITNEVVSSIVPPSAEAEASGEGRRTTICHPVSGPTNRDRARALGKAEKAEEKRKKAAAAAAQRAEEKRRGFTERVVNGATVVTMIGSSSGGESGGAAASGRGELATSSRGRTLKRATYQDGSKIPDKPVVKNVRSAAPAASKTKRKAADSGGNGGSKK